MTMHRRSERSAASTSGHRSTPLKASPTRPTRAQYKNSPTSTTQLSTALAREDHSVPRPTSPTPPHHQPRRSTAPTHPNIQTKRLAATARQPPPLRHTASPQRSRHLRSPAHHATLSRSSTTDNPTHASARPLQHDDESGVSSDAPPVMFPPAGQAQAAKISSAPRAPLTQTPHDPVGTPAIVPAQSCFYFRTRPSARSCQQSPYARKQSRRRVSG